MFLSEERQSLMRLRQEVDETHLLELHPPSGSSTVPPQATDSGPPSEDYDEWACIQRELGCLSATGTSSGGEPSMQRHSNACTTTVTPVTTSTHAHLQPPKRTSSSDSRLETLKRFRHNKRSSLTDIVHNNSVLHNNSSVQSVSSGINTHYHHHYQNPNSYEQQVGQHDSYSSQNDENDVEVENNSIDEQVQSAIDSILNLQQNTALDLDSILS